MVKVCSPETNVAVIDDVFLPGSSSGKACLVLPWYEQKVWNPFWLVSQTEMLLEHVSMLGATGNHADTQLNNPLSFI